MAYSGTPSPLAMGGACCQKAWHHELRGGDGLYLPKQEGATATALVTFAPQFQYQGAVGKRRFVDLAQDRTAWNEFGNYFTQYVEAQVLREDTRATFARDAREPTCNHRASE